MPKIPQGLTDKDMIKNYVEEETVEQQLLKVAKKAERFHAMKCDEPPALLTRAGFTPELIDKLGKELLALRIELSNSGIKNYNFKIKRDKEKITLVVTDKKFDDKKE